MDKPILDSGSRVTFETGAKRDMQEGKGRFDLLPFDAYCFFTLQKCKLEIRNRIESTLDMLESFMKSRDLTSLYMAVDYFSLVYEEDMLIELSKHFEKGTKKYGEDNWKKGIPTKSYLNSAMRHLYKFCSGWDDEDHGIAFVWNLVCLKWTIENHPELDNINYTNKQEDKTLYKIDL